jgi:peptidoglycan hydrolase-like protein with peptidoglycan-binding domain
MTHPYGFERTASHAIAPRSFEWELSAEINRQSSDYVRWLQASLNRALGLRLAVDGLMGTQTRSALRSFQQRAGLKPDGRPGPLTERALSAAGAGSPPLDGVSPGGGATPATPVAPSIPALLNSETAPPAQTLYVNIALGSESPARAMTGIFIPPDYRPEPQVDLILYLQGFKPEGHAAMTIDSYWNTRAFPYWPFREVVADVRKNALLVAPTLGPRSQTGKLTQQRGGLDSYIAQVLAALAAHGPYRNTGQTPRLGHLILACHSGGGLPMRQLALSNNRAAQQIRECWGFDCTYNRGDDTEWARWARARPDSRLFIYYLAGTRTAVLSQSLKRLNVPNVLVAASSARGHNWVPIQHWRERIQAAVSLRNL